jgi:hypothetical protein
MIDEETEDVLLDAEVVGDHAEFVSVRGGAGFAHLFGPGGSGEVDGILLPIVGFVATDAAG